MLNTNSLKLLTRSSIHFVCRENEFSYREGAFNSGNAPGRFSRSHTPKFDVLLTSYEMVSMDKVTFASIEWDVMIIDEAHRLRSNQSLVSTVTCLFALQNV